MTSRQITVECTVHLHDEHVEQIQTYIGEQGTSAKYGVLELGPAHVFPSLKALKAIRDQVQLLIDELEE